MLNFRLKKIIMPWNFFGLSNNLKNHSLLLDIMDWDDNGETLIKTLNEN